MAKFKLLENLSDGTYTIYVKDNKQNFKTVAAPTVTIIRPDPITVVVDSFTDPLCPGNHNGTITVTASGGWPVTDSNNYDYYYF